MSWIQILSNTYDNNSSYIGVMEDNAIPLLPIGHITVKRAHVNVFLDRSGIFKRATIIPETEARTIIPATQESESRASGPRPHALTDRLQYLAPDYKDRGGKKSIKCKIENTETTCYEFYKKQLQNWCKSDYSHPKVRAVLSYIEKGCLIDDLLKAKVFFADSNGKLQEKWEGTKDVVPAIFEATKNSGGQIESLIRWHVEIPGDPLSDLSKDNTVWNSWKSYYADSLIGNADICFATGEKKSIAEMHPRKIRNDGDGAKLISSNDLSGFTFRGRFTDKYGKQACGLSYETTQKAHSALRWLIGRKQAFKNGDQVIVSWAVSGKEIPDPLSNSYDLFAADNVDSEDYQGDSGQGFAQRLKRYIAGYSAKLGSTNNIVVLGLDSASPGRLSITFYRELTGSEFLGRIEKWHSDLVWKQRISIEDNTEERKKQKIIWPVCAPAPKDIAQATYGTRIDDKLKKALKKATIERLLPCIIDGQPIPRDLVDSTIHRACNRIGLEHWEWEKVLGIACSLYKGYYLRNPKEKRSYFMALESDRTSRDYLYGRLLAVAEHIENLAINVGGEKRDTTASKLMQRFADRPFSTWKTIELALTSYKTRLQSKRPGYLYQKKDLLDKIHTLFLPGDYENDTHLSGEFLLGYHCQREALKLQNEKPETEEESAVEKITE